MKPLSLAQLVLSKDELRDFKRPRFVHGVKQAVMEAAAYNERGQRVCAICHQGVVHGGNINHKVRWADIREQALNDPMLVSLTRRERKDALSELYNDVSNLELTHPRCNDRHSHRIDSQRFHEQLTKERMR